MYIVQLFNREKEEYIRFKKINEAHRDAHIRSIWYYSIFFPIVEILSAVSVGLLIWWGGIESVMSNDVTLGEIIAFILLILLFSGNGWTKDNVIETILSGCVCN